MVEGHIWGPLRDYRLRFILDSGAAHTALTTQAATNLGYTVSSTNELTTVATATRVERWPLVRVDRIAFLGLLRADFPVLIHDLPTGTHVHGLLGLDFFAGHKLCLDLSEGTLELT